MQVGFFSSCLPHEITETYCSFFFFMLDDRTFETPAFSRSQLFHFSHTSSVPRERCGFVVDTASSYLPFLCRAASNVEIRFSVDTFVFRLDTHTLVCTCSYVFLCGQVVAMEGVNSSGRRFVASRIHEVADCLLCLLLLLFCL